MSAEPRAVRSGPSGGARAMRRGIVIARNLDWDYDRPVAQTRSRSSSFRKQKSMSTLDFGALLQDLSPGEPCGKNLEDAPEFRILEQKAEGTPERQLGDRIEPAQEPDWNEVRGLAVELSSRTRDLRVLMILTRALLATEGLAGLADGLSLTVGALQNHWETVHPQLDPDDGYDPTQRINILEALNSYDALIRWLIRTPLVESRVLGRFSLRDVQLATGKLKALPGEPTAPQSAAVDAAFLDCELTDLTASHEAATRGLDELGKLESILTDRVGASQAPNFDPLRSVLREIAAVLRERLNERGALPLDQAVREAAPSELPPASPTGAPVFQGQPGAIGSRQDVARVLDLLCDYYARCEPSSPIPLLLQRAKRLVHMDFLEIIRDLAPDGLAQVEVIRGKSTSDEAS